MKIRSVNVIWEHALYLQSLTHYTTFPFAELHNKQYFFFYFLCIWLTMTNPQFQGSILHFLPSRDALYLYDHINFCI